MAILKRRTLRLLTTILAAVLCAGTCLTLLPGRALAAACTVPGDYSNLSEAFAATGITQVTLQGVTDSSVSTIPSGKTVTLSGSSTIAASGELTVNGAINGSGSISASSVYVTRSGSVGSAVNYSGTVYWEQSIGVSGVTRIVGSNGTDANPTETSNGYYKTTARNPSAVYAGTDKYVSTGAGFSREYSITYVSQDPNTPCTNGNPTAYTAQTGVIILKTPTVTFPDYTFVQWQLANGTKVATLDTSSLSGDIVIYAVWKQSAAAAAAAGKTGSVAGGGGGTFAAAVSGTSDSDDDDDDTATTATTTTTTNGFGNMRVRMASSTTRHTIRSDTDADVQALANQRAAKNRFPWQWAGVALGAAALLSALAVTLKRREKEKTAAMLEKLNIKE